MKKTILFIAALTAGSILSAQNLNPEVSVTGDYAVKMSKVDKNATRMDVPDSLFKFDYKFDYSVFDSPYHGSYEFTPYAIQISPTSEKEPMRRFYLNGGIGFTPRPEIEAVYTPVLREGFSLTVFDEGHGYWGPYRAVGNDMKPSSSDPWWGYDFQDRLGVEGRAVTGTSDILFAAGADGIFTADNLKASNYASAYAGGRIASNSGSDSFFDYDAGLKYRFGYDDLGAGRSVVENSVMLDASVGPDLMENYSFLLDFNLQFNACSGEISTTQSMVQMKPHFDFSAGPFDMTVGAMLSYSDKMTVYPAIRASVDLFRDYLRISADVSGSEQYNSYWNMKNFNHRFDPSYCGLDVTRERLNASLSIGGHAANSFQYSLKGGWAMVQGAPLYLGNMLHQELLAYASYNMFHADASLAWSSDRFDADAAVSFRLTDLDESAGCFDLPLVTSRMKFMYNWNRRIFAGLWGEVNTGSKALVNSGTVELEMAPWVNLGMEGKYVFNSRWAAWMRAGNLLGQDIRRSPLYSEKGLTFTAGFALSL